MRNHKKRLHSSMSDSEWRDLNLIEYKRLCAPANVNAAISYCLTWSGYCKSIIHLVVLAVDSVSTAVL